jgi:hypothetical protein
VKITIGLLAVLGLLVIAANFLLPYIVDCQSVQIRSAQSPNGTYVASISSSTCENPAESGTSVYIRNTQTGEMTGTQAFDNSSTDFELTWRSDREVVVVYPRSVDQVGPAREINGAMVRFQQR